MILYESKPPDTSFFGQAGRVHIQLLASRPSEY